MHGSSKVPQSVMRNAAEEKAAGVKAQRDKGFKHFNKVGYINGGQKEVPRWAVNGDALKKVLMYQAK